MRFAQYKPRVTFTQRGAPHVWPDTPYLKHSRLAEWLHVDCHKHELAGCALPIPHLLVPAQVSANCCACVPSSVRRVDRTGVVVVDSPANLARRPSLKVWQQVAMVPRGAYLRAQDLALQSCWPLLRTSAACLRVGRCSVSCDTSQEAKHQTSHRRPTC